MVLALALALGMHAASAAGASLLTDAELHEKAIVVDGHVHVINQVYTLGQDPWVVQPVGTMDYARARQGGLDVVIENLTIDDSYNDYNYAVKQAVRLIETFHRVVDANPDKMALALSSADVRRIVAHKKLAVVLALEGGFDMEGDLDVLRLFARLGVRMIQVVSHETTNALADAKLPKWQGLSERGRAVIEEMNRLGVIVDVSHASEASKLAMIEASRAPVVTSHNGLKHFNPDVSGNMSDEALARLAGKGGLFALHSAAWILSDESLKWGAYWPRALPAPPGNERFDFKGFRERIDYGDDIAKLDALNVDKRLYNYGYSESWRERQKRVVSQGAQLPTADDSVNQVAYVIDKVGPDHVGIGLDQLTGGHWLRDFDGTSYPLLTAAMRRKGFSDEVILKVLGENWLRLLDAAKVP